MRQFLIAGIICLLSIPAFGEGNKDKHKAVKEEKLCTAIEDFTTLVSMNPYDNVDRCFSYVGGLIQLLGKNKALYGLMSSGVPFALIDFGDKSAQMIAYGGLVKGKGAYTYEAANGSLTTVHLFGMLSKSDEEYFNQKKAEYNEKMYIQQEQERSRQAKIKEEEELYNKQLLEQKKKDEEALKKEQERQALLQQEREIKEKAEHDKYIDYKIKESGLVVNNGVIIDKKTGLMWMSDANPFADAVLPGNQNQRGRRRNANGKMTYTQAITYISNLNYAGYSDWRLPTTSELLSLSKYGSDVLTGIANNLQQGCYWSTSKTIFPSSLFHKDCVYMTNGSVDAHYADGNFNPQGTDYIWPVRGGGAVGWFKRVLQ